MAVLAADRLPHLASSAQPEFTASHPAAGTGAPGNTTFDLCTGYKVTGVVAQGSGMPNCGHRIQEHVPTV